ncbi:hypothetical protein LG293_16925 (plasmid) [Citricoccus nitrophenolicus]
MLFIIALVIVIAFPVICYFRGRGWDMVPIGIGSGVVMGLALFYMGVLLASVSEPTSTREVGQESLKLVAVDSDENLHGRVSFLSGGTLNEQDVFRYRYEANGGFNSGRIDAADATIFEDATAQDARLVTTTVEESHWWLMPWPSRVSETHALHVPAGSVPQDFNLAFD